MKAGDHFSGFKNYFSINFVPYVAYRRLKPFSHKRHINLKNQPVIIFGLRMSFSM